MIPIDVEVSHHAWQRFVTRYLLYRPAPPQCYMKEFLRLTGTAKQVSLGYGEALRIMDNNLEGAKYYEAEGWRFVLSEDLSRMMTVERITFRKRRSKGHKPRWKY